MMTILLTYTATVTPYQVAFIEQDKSWMIVDLVIDSLFGIDVIINCFTAYFDSEDNLVTDQKKILIHYATGWMLLDIIACIPF